MAYRIERTPEFESDLLLIFDFLVQSFVAHGEPTKRAVTMAGERLLEIRDDLMTLGRVPHIGTLLPQLGPGMRRLTRRRAIFYFVVDDAEQMVRVLAVFYGGQDHQRRMLVRLTGRG